MSESLPSMFRQRLSRLRCLTTVIAVLMTPVSAMAAGLANLADSRVLDRVTQKLLPGSQRARNSRAPARDLAVPRLDMSGATEKAVQPLDAPRGAATAGLGESRHPVADETESGFELRSGAKMPIHWQNAPEWVRTARTYRRGAIPIVHLWSSSSAVVAIGVSRHGVPGIYLTQKIRD
jgi:hypothetical protein